MITLSDFKKLDELESEIKKFIFEKCKEYSDAKELDYVSEHFDDDFDWYEFDGLYLKVYFEEYRTYGISNQYCCTLPLDILFESDFKERTEQIAAEERELERIRLLEKRKAREAEAEKKQLRIQQEEIKELKELMKKYPDIVKCESVVQ